MKTYYDALFYDELGFKLYLEYVETYLNPGSVIELACGSGDLLNALQTSHDVFGVDIDQRMLDLAAKKYPELDSKLSLGDFTSFKSNKKYDNLVCIGDSLNYLLDKEDLFSFIDHSIRLSDHIILDSHHPARLDEFEEGFFEEGSTEEFDYAYEIRREEDFLIHTINFLDGNFDVIYQWVFDPKMLIERYESLGYEVKVLNDFTESEIQITGEKVRYVIDKVIL